MEIESRTEAINFETPVQFGFSNAKHRDKKAWVEFFEIGVSRNFQADGQKSFKDGEIGNQAQWQND